MILGASLGDVSELAAIVALGEPVGGDDRGDLSGTGEETDGGSHRRDILWSDGDSNGGSEFSLSGGGVWVEKSGREDGDPPRIADRGSQGIEEVVRICGKVRDREGVDGQLGLVGGEPKWEPGGLTNWQRLVESGSNGIKKGCVGRCRGLYVRDDNGYGTAGVDFHCEPEWKHAVIGTEKGRNNVGEGSGDVFVLGVEGRRRSRGEETTFDTREGPPFQLPKGGLSQGRDLCGTPR